MLIHADFSQSIILTPEQYEWIASPQKGVDRVMLDRIGAEKARATSLVRYAPNSIFPPHSHPQGEEILVLEGTFSEQDHDYPAGWYLRNPDGTSHQPFSHEGAVIFVKLRQMSRDDQQTVRINTNLSEAWHVENNQKICSLFQNHNEQVELRQIHQNDQLNIAPDLLTEILILDGTLKINQQVLPTGSWIRLAKGSSGWQITAETQVKLYIKTMKKITNLD
ncbi:cupin domain-containing protein [Acinetobacter sp. MB5]|uniref:cupin domain-containing protein n=1 Tax=Acinetobacter sp. MB5 TaxID=2069438 RepID=UPI000DD07771|nr:cupin domain-containing protein [Acinetobacter sp. MB5]